MAESAAKRSKESERVLITGGQGFFGAWMTKQLLDEGAEVTIFDLREDDNILAQVLTAAQVAGLTRVFGDVSDAKVVKDAVAAANPSSIIHLAGLQIPTCRANPRLGAMVNVIGTINVFEAARAQKDANDGVAPTVIYASSAAVLGPKTDYPEADVPVKDDYYHKPRTIYGVYKICNEGCARIYYQDHGVKSVGLRPLTCFGVGRELGMTSGPTKAIKAAVLGRKYECAFIGETGFSYVEDIARIFIGCTRAKFDDALAFGIRGECTTVEEFFEEFKKALPEAADLVSYTGNAIPIMGDVDESGLTALLATVPAPFKLKGPFPMPLADSIKRTAELFTALKAEGRLKDNDLP